MSERVYQILDWDGNFENEKSRVVSRCAFVCMPNKRGMGLTHLLAMPDGVAMFGVFVLLAELCSRQAKPRDGWVTDDGQNTGRGYDVDDLSAMFSTDKSLITRALDALSSARIGWLRSWTIEEAAAMEMPEAKERSRVLARERPATPRANKGPTTGHGPRVARERPASGPSEQKGMEQKGTEGTSGSAAHCSTATAGAATLDQQGKPTVADPGESPAAHESGGSLKVATSSTGRSGERRSSAANGTSSGLLDFPTTPGKQKGPLTWWLTAELRDELGSLFEGVDVLAEAKRCKAWVLGDPGRNKKTAAGMRKTLTTWLDNSVKRGNALRIGRSTAGPPGELDDDALIPTAEVAARELEEAFKHG